jgi:hypothetical protein
MKRTATDAIALARFLTLAELVRNSDQSQPHIVRVLGTHLHDPTVASDLQYTINAALVVVLFAGGGKRRALVLQAAQVLPVPAIDDARAPSGEAACEE